MHELGIACRIADIACETALQGGYSSVRRMVIEVGNESGAISRLLEREMPYACKGTIAQSAKIKVRSVKGDKIALRSIRAA